MIGYLRGRVKDRLERGILIDVNGIGYEVQMPASDLAHISAAGDREVELFTHLIWKEDAVTLYGFRIREVRDIFRIMLEVSGVGPRLAINILSALSPAKLLPALASEETAVLEAVHGVGKKTAARLCIDLKERATRMLDDAAIIPEPEYQDVARGRHVLWNDALSALTHLGYRRGEAKEVLGSVLSEEDGTNLEEIVRNALQELARSQIS